MEYLVAVWFEAPEGQPKQLGVYVMDATEYDAMFSKTYNPMPGVAYAMPVTTARCMMALAVYQQAH